MDSLFWIQTIVAFFVGGLAISALTIFAEKAPPNLSGVILALPTNMVIGLFFLALVNSPQIIAENLNGVPLTLSGAILYVVAYLIVAYYFFDRHKFNKYWIITGCLISAFLAWLIFPLLMALEGAPRLSIGLAIFLFIVFVTQYFLIKLNQKHKSKPKVITAKTNLKTVVFRAILAGSVIVIALIVSKTLGPFWGVVVGSSFPAAYTATLIALHLNYETRTLIEITKMLPLGTTGQMFYVLAIAYTYEPYGIWIGTLIAYGATVMYYVILTQFHKRLT